MNRASVPRKRLLAIGLILALGLLALDRYAAFAHRPAPDSKQVVIYTTAWCGYCAKLRRDLAANQIPYREYDVETSLPGMLGMWTLHARGIPFAAIGPKVVYGYRVEEIGAALESLGYRYQPVNGALSRDHNLSFQKTVID